MSEAGTIDCGAMTETVDRDPWADVLVDAVGEGEARELVGELVRGWNVKAGLAAARQARIARQAHAVGRRCVDGIGQPVASIDLQSYYFWANKLGGECWKDAPFRREFLRDNPHCRIKVERRAAIIRP
jgi:hypothetical protein